jgi:REP element-mobilizing transposase RayT
MPKRIHKSSRVKEEFYEGRHRFEHWYVDNQVYFITARCRDRFPAFASEQAKAVFWVKFDQYTKEFGFEPWVTSLMDNHYHTVGYLKHGQSLMKMMQRLHGSVAKLVNDLLPQRRTNFFRDRKGHEYFDGCLRNEKQYLATYRYIWTQSRRHGICLDPRDYPHTRVIMELEPGLERALQLGAFMPGVPYPRLERKH